MAAHATTTSASLFSFRNDMIFRRIMEVIHQSFGHFDALATRRNGTTILINSVDAYARVPLTTTPCTLTVTGAPATFGALLAGNALTALQTACAILSAVPK
jgi:hypothetical protein